MGSVLKPFQNILSPGSKQTPTGKLSIDWNHPLTQRLEFCVITNEKRSRELVRELPMFIPAAHPAESINSYGSCLSFSSAGRLDYGSTVSDVPFLGPVSAFVGGVPIASTMMVVSKGIGTSTNCPFALWGNAGGQLRFTRSNATNQRRYYASEALSFGVPHIWGATDAGTSAATSFYNDGVQLTSNDELGYNTPPWTGTNSPMSVAGDSASLYSGTLNFVYVWSRVLNRNEISFLTASPFDFIIPAEYEMPIISTTPSFIPWRSQQSNLPVIGGGTF